jgi:thiol-disulfide isomerase/thioredoxin
VKDVQGHTVSLAGLLEPGRPLALIFVSPGCGPCAAILPDLSHWQKTLTERLAIGLVSTGDALDNHEAQQLGLTNVLLQKDDEIMNAYRVEGTPSAVMVSPDGRIASTAAAGATAIEPLIRVTLRRHTNATSVDTVPANVVVPTQHQGA